MIKINLDMENKNEVIFDGKKYRSEGEMPVGEFFKYLVIKIKNHPYLAIYFISFCICVYLFVKNDGENIVINLIKELTGFDLVPIIQSSEVFQDNWFDLLFCIPLYLISILLHIILKGVLIKIFPNKSVRMLETFESIVISAVLIYCYRNIGFLK